MPTREARVSCDTGSREPVMSRTKIFCLQPHLLFSLLQDTALTYRSANTIGLAQVLAWCACWERPRHRVFGLPAKNTSRGSHRSFSFFICSATHVPSVLGQALLASSLPSSYYKATTKDILVGYRGKSTARTEPSADEELRTSTEKALDSKFIGTSMLESLAVEFNILFRFVSGHENEENVDLHPPVPMPSPGPLMMRMEDAGEPSGAKFSGETPNGEVARSPTSQLSLVHHHSFLMALTESE